VIVQETLPTDIKLKTVDKGTCVIVQETLPTDIKLKTVDKGTCVILKIFLYHQQQQQHVFHLQNVHTHIVF
jgi:uncharacterized membrane protein